VPKEHIPTIVDLTEETADLIGYLHFKTNEIAKEAGVLENGFRLICNYGKDGDQIIQHIHFHILGGRFLTWPPG